MKKTLFALLSAFVLASAAPSIAIAESQTEKPDISSGEAVRESIDILGTWVGYYTGSDSDNSSLKRNIRISIGTHVNEKITGVAYIERGDMGSYYFEGTLNPETNEIEFSGTQWYNNPSNMGFANFKGVLNEKGTIKGINEGSKDRPFLLAKTSGEYEVPEVSKDAVLSCGWTGEYDGQRDYEAVRRNIEFEITEINESGDVEAMVYISPSDVADINDSVFGKYYARGSIDLSSGFIHLQGYEWIWYPVPAVEGNYDAVGNFEFVVLEGRLNEAEKTIDGYTEKGIWKMTQVEAAEGAADILTAGLEVGDKIALGTYDLDGISEAEEGLQWIICAKDGAKALLVSDLIIDAIPFAEEFGPATWETSSIREWLNNSFLDNHFSEAQQSMILSSSCENGGNSEYGETPNAETEDKIFLLSEQEIQEYFEGKDYLAAEISDLAKTGMSMITGQNHAKETGAWMLRTNGLDEQHIAFVDPRGEINTEGVPVNADYIGIRPAMWVNLED